MQLLSANPGQNVIVILEVKDAAGIRVDADALPSVTRLILPGFVSAPGYPLPMAKVDVGIYAFGLAIPSGAQTQSGGSTCGTYLVDVSYSVATLPATELYQIVVTTPYVNSGFGMSPA
jgi:hypothetical protein